MMNVPANSAPARSSALGPGTGQVSHGRLLAFIAAISGLAIIPLIFADATGTMISTWMESSTFNHGPMIPVLAAYLAWRRRDQLSGVQPRFEWIGLAAVAAALMVWLVGRLSATMIVQQFGLVLTLQAFVLCVLGRDVVRRLLFPLFYLIFAVPFGAELVPPLQDITAFFVVSLLRLVGIPVFIDGVFITTPAGNYLVAEACAGLRYLISTIALGLVFANLTFHSWQRRAIFIALTLTVPIIANGIRAFLIVLIAYLSNNEIAVGIDHIIYGWVFFSLVTFLLFAAGYAMREPLEEFSVPPLRRRQPASRTAPIAAAVAAVALAAGASFYADRAVARTASLDPGIHAPDMPGFSRILMSVEGWRPRFMGADRQIDQVYEKAGRRVDLNIGLYARERQGAKAVTVHHDFESEPVWKSGETAAIEVDLPGRTLSAMSLRLSAPGRYRLIWYWYWVDGEFTGSPYAAKLLQMKALLTGGNPAAAIIAVSAEYPPSLGEPASLLRDMMAALPILGTTLEQATRGERLAGRTQ